MSNRSTSYASNISLGLGFLSYSRCSRCVTANPEVGVSDLTSDVGDNPIGGHKSFQEIMEFDFQQVTL
jgi:hypothetical protein